MITTIELMSQVLKMVKASTFKSVLTGDAYLATRPLNSVKNDIVIGSLSLPKEVVRFGTILVTMYAKDLMISNNYVPNLKVLQDAAKILHPVFDGIYIPEISTYIDIEYERAYKVDGVQEWAYVIRLKTRTVNK